MTEDGNAFAARRFLRTLRVATATALAEYDLARGRAQAAPAAQFRALAAKGPDGWRFPDAGLASQDGLLLASLLRDDTGAPLRLDLQAQGSAGLSIFAERDVELRLGPAMAVEGAFDRDGRWSVPLSGQDVDEPALAAFDLRFRDRQP